MAVVLLIGHCLGSSFYGWRNSFNLTWFFCGKKTQEGLEGLSFVHFLTIWKERNWRAFKSGGQPIQLLKCSFLRGIVLWVIMDIEEGLMPLIGFVDWVEYNWGRAVFLCSLFLEKPLVPILYILCTLVYSFFIHIHDIFLLAYQKRLCGCDALVCPVLLVKNNNFYYPWWLGSVGSLWVLFCVWVVIVSQKDLTSNQT